MAKKSNTLWGKVCNVVSDILGHIVATIVCVVWGLLWLIAFMTSPVWIPVYLLSSPENCADLLTSDMEVDNGDTRYMVFLVKVKNITCHTLLSLYGGIIRRLPMKRYQYFIKERLLSGYPVSTQIKYYMKKDDDKKREILKQRMSYEATQELWKKYFNERKKFVEVGKKLSEKQILDLIHEGYSDLLWSYFKSSTPDKEMTLLLVEQAQNNYQAAQDVVLKLIRQQKPSAEIVEKLLACSDQFLAEVRKVLDYYADMSAVFFSVHDIEGADEDAKKETVLTAWEKYCISRDGVCVGAQKKMCEEQYEIYHKVGLKLHPTALTYLCMNTTGSFLRKIFQGEFGRIDEKLQALLQTDYLRYGLYLSVKEDIERKEKISVGKV